VHLKAGYRTA